LGGVDGPATDLGFLSYKNPARVQSFELSFGRAHIFYPEATPERCTAALLLDVDPVHLVRGQHSSWQEYVSDRPYVASSFLSVAIAQVLGSALAGQSVHRPELARTALPLEAKLAAVPCRGGEAVLRALFEPLGYAVTSEPEPLDATWPEWGVSSYFTVRLTGTLRLGELLTHLYVLIPVLDAEKHYWVGDDEVDKLLKRGEGWLANHPARDFIVRRYLKHQGKLVQSALAQLVEEDDLDPDAAQAGHAQEEAEVEARLSLHEQRLGSVLGVLRNAGVHRVLDLGCGEGRLGTCGTKTIALSGRGASSTPGPVASLAVSATTCAACPSGRKIPGWARPLKWACSPCARRRRRLTAAVLWPRIGRTQASHEAHAPRIVTRGPGWPIGLG
jgi:3' terminal RNA ribose 2'-O-methyltransferase Hen1